MNTIMTMLASTVAYWPMNLTQDAKSNRIVADSTENGYDLAVRAESLGGISFSDNDIGWTLPPNPDATGAACKQFITTAPGSKSDDKYQSALSISSEPLSSALAADKDFTIEGWLRMTAMPESGAKYLIAVNTLGQKGGWAWQFIQTSTAGVYTVKIDLNTTGSRTTYDVSARITADEVLNKWNHFALVHLAAATEKNGEWQFYLNGHKRGYNQKSPIFTDIGTMSSFYFSGVGSKTAQHIVGDATCWRVSDTPLVPGQFLCDIKAKDTVAYWTMSSIGTTVPSTINTDTDLTLRSSSKGDLEIIANDIGWTKPPNADPQSDNTAVWTSDTALRFGSGTASYSPILSSTNQTLAEALTPTNDFCIEGWFCPSELPATSSANHMLVYSTLGWYGGWAWNLYGADDNGKCAVKVLLERGRLDGSTGSSRKTYTLGSIDSSAILNKWNHYALSYDADALRWKFFFNGKLQGSEVGVAITNVPARTFQTYLFGAPSGTAQIPIGKATTWRVTRNAFTPSRFLCGDMTAANTYTWTGAENGEWSKKGYANWKDNDGNACAWKEYMRAFVGKAAAITIRAPMSPSALTVDCNDDVSITVNKSCPIQAVCQEIIKDGAGTLHFIGSSDSPLNNSANRVLVKGGTLRVSNPNGDYSLGDARKGFDVFVCDGATLAVDQRNAIGRTEQETVNHSRIVVYTNGVFDLRCPNNFNIQTLGTLELRGGDLIPPLEGHDGNGYLKIRDRVSFGLRPDKKAYAFYPSDTKYDNQMWQYCTNTVFDVADITDDDEPDVVFYNHILASKAWHTNTANCCFHKTGDGTMALRQSRGNFYSDKYVCYPTGEKAINTVEAGELRVDCDYSGPAFQVLDGAFLSGTGVVSTVRFANGAGIRGALGESKELTISGDCTVEGSGTIQLRTNGSTRQKARLMTVGGEFFGEDNLKDWKVFVDGVEQPDYKVELRNKRLVVGKQTGLMLLIN